MFLLDTNVVSELRRARRTDPNVAAWAESVLQEDMFLSSVTILELEMGALRHARRDGDRGRAIQRWIQNRVLPAFADRILAVDTNVALRCAQLHVPNPRPYRDSLIAATALVHGLIVATRNRVDFETMAVPLLNPWEGPQS
jgi:predicted nucleic acid-binding protein